MQLTAIVFVLLAFVFTTLATRDYVQLGSSITPARKAWIRAAIIFGAAALIILATRGL